MADSTASHTRTRRVAGQYSSSTSKKQSLAQKARRAAMDPEALDLFRETRRAYYQKLTAAGKCWRCRHPNPQSGAYCPACVLARTARRHELAHTDNS